MIKATCIQKIRDKNNNIKAYILQDENKVQMKFSSEQVKQAMFLKQLDVVNLKLTSDGKLIDNNQKQNLPAANNNITLDKIKDLNCYDLLKFNIDAIPQLVSKYTGFELKEITFIDSYYSKFYAIGNYNIVIGKEDEPDCISDYHKCPKASHCENLNGLPIFCMDAPLDSDIVNDIMKKNGHIVMDEADIGIYDGGSIINLMELYKRILRKTNITYYEIVIKLYDLMSKFTDNKYGTINNNLSLYTKEDNFYNGHEDTRNEPIIQRKWDGVSAIVFRLKFSKLTNIIYSFLFGISESSGYRKELPIRVDETILRVSIICVENGYKIQICGVENYLPKDTKHLYSVCKDNDKYGKLNMQKVYRRSIIQVVNFNENLTDTIDNLKTIIGAEFRAALSIIKQQVAEFENKKTDVCEYRNKR